MTAETDPKREQALALATCFQCLYLIDRIAHSGQCDEDAEQACLDTLFEFDANTSSEALGVISNATIGLRCLNDLLSGRRENEYRSLLRYFMAVVHVQQHLRRDTDRVKIIRSRLEHTERNRELSDRQALIAGIAGVYTDTVSTLKFRISVSGNQQHLRNAQQAQRIRALLLAALRALFLWRAQGGRRWRLVFGRGAILKACRDCLAEIDRCS